MSDGCSVPTFLQVMFPRMVEVCRECGRCCQSHDEAYYNGTDGDEPGRKRADEAFRHCLLGLAFTGRITYQDADTFYHMVRLFGGPHYGHGRSWDGRRLWEQAAEEQQSP